MPTASHFVCFMQGCCRPYFNLLSVLHLRRWIPKLMQCASFRIYAISAKVHVLWISLFKTKYIWMKHDIFHILQSRGTRRGTRDRWIFPCNPWKYYHGSEISDDERVVCHGNTKSMRRWDRLKLMSFTRITLHLFISKIAKKTESMFEGFPYLRSRKLTMKNCQGWVKDFCPKSSLALPPDVFHHIR